jgi:DNA-binding NtrC family response regulator
MAQILLIEDDLDARLIMEHALIDGGHKVSTARTVLGGRELLRHRCYDLVIADGRMPDGNGMELADEAHQNGAAFLVVTGYAFELAKADPVGFDFLVKPVRSDELLRAVERALRIEGT